MKKRIVIDELAICFLSAVAYGIGFLVPDSFGCPFIVSFILCFIPGLIVEEIAEKIIFTKFIQKSLLRRIIAWLGCVAFFLIGTYISISVFGENLNSDLAEEFAYLLVVPLVSLIISYVVFCIKRRYILDKYGNGARGYIIDKENREYIESLNGTNHVIEGKYNKKLSVRTRTGIYVGKRQRRHINSYLGIPYARPPIGDRRWQKPARLPNSDVVHEAFYFGPSSLQPASKGNTLSYHQQSEDCLYLNVWCSACHRNAKKPVIVYFHDGDYSYGGSANPIENAEALVRKNRDIVAVSFNYRLGVLGFIDFTDLPDGAKYKDALNCGVLDQIQALKWVKENIHAFGGDPDNITLMGSNSGATSAMILSGLKETKGLFGRVFSVSYSSDYLYYDNISSRRLGCALAKEFHAKTVQDLLNVPTNQLKKAVAKYTQEGGAPVCDGKFLPKDIDEIFKRGTENNIEYVIGLPEDEISNIRAILGDEAVRNELEKWRQDLVNERELYGHVSQYLKKTAVNKNDEYAKLVKVVNFISFIYAPLLSARYLSSNGHKVHCFLWNITPSVKNFKSNSLSFISTIMGNFGVGEEFGYINDNTLREIMQLFLNKFVHNEKIELYNNEIIGVEAFDWPLFKEDNYAVACFNQKSMTIKYDFYKKEITTLDQILGRIV